MPGTHQNKPTTHHVAVIMVPYECPKGLDPSEAADSICRDIAGLYPKAWLDDALDAPDVPTEADLLMGG